MAPEINKHCVKVQYDKFVCPHHYSEGNLVLLYDQDIKPLGVGKFNPMSYRTMKGIP